MAEGFEVYHVPQQSRRDKLRVGIGIGTTNSTNSINHHSNFFPLYDDPSSFISSDFDFHQNPSFQLYHHHNYPPTSAVTAAALHHHLPPLLSDQQPPLSLDLNLQHRYAYHSTFPLQTSKFFKPAQQLLHDLFDYAPPNSSDKLLPDSALLDTLEGDIPAAADDGLETHTTKSRLITMLHEVYRRYKLYYQQMQAVVTTFEYAAGLGNAAPYANLAVKAMFKHFKFLKNAIADQLQFNKQHQPPSCNPYSQRSIINNHGAGFVDHQPVWRPQRGLPESAVTVLRAWLFEHFLHPYPTDTDKLMLANQTGLSRSQVSNWFINARVRLWKPMVEEIHMLETRQAQKSQQKEANNSNALNNNNDHLSSTNESLLKPDGHNHNKASSSNHDHHPLDLSNTHFFPTHHLHAAAGATAIGGSGNVSLTLGLQQNHGGITLTEPFPINAAQHFNLGLEANGEGFVNEWF
ncbi:unnamed protein product [Citrullus colocynthis]|uniref:Homeobox domain-containing protein n=1 Tax=Citrullus colocynthis TaxID=252529 RepID=A0ABP0YHF5_9ROSI